MSVDDVAMVMDAPAYTGVDPRILLVSNGTANLIFHRFGNFQIALNQGIDLRNPTLEFLGLVLPRLTALTLPNAVEGHLRQFEAAKENGKDIQRVLDRSPGNVCRRGK